MNNEEKDMQTENNETGKKPKSKVRKVLGIIANVLMWAFIVFAIVITILAFSAQSSEDGIPTVGGKVFSTVLTDSMSPTINKGDLIITTKLIEPADKANLEKYSIISFKADLDGDNKKEINTHRIVDILPGGSYRTMGDKKGTTEEARLNEDNWDLRAVAPSDVISVYEGAQTNSDKTYSGTRIPGLGAVISFLMTPTGFFIVVVIPLILFFLFELIMFVRKLIEVKNSGKKQITAADEELIKQRAIEEYLRSQQSGGEPEKAPIEETAPPEDTPSEEAPVEEAPCEDAPIEGTPVAEAPDDGKADAN